MPTGEQSGGCQCGAVRYRAVVKDDDLHGCHCGICRHIAGGPFLGVDVSELEFDEGAALTRYKASEWATRTFCSRRGTALAWQTDDGHYQTVAAWTLDRAPEGSLTLEIFIEEKPAGYAFAGDATRMTGQELMAMAKGESQ